MNTHLPPLLIVDDVAWEGPVRESRTEQLIGEGKRDLEHAQRCIAAFAERAFRRPLRDEEKTRLAVVAERNLAKGISFEKAVKEPFSRYFARRIFSIWSKAHTRLRGCA